jgi:DNA-binding HxlR family transcriptional regulator
MIAPGVRDDSRKRGYSGTVVTVTPDQTASIDGAGKPSRTERLGYEQCAVARCAELIGGKWMLLVVRDLATGPKSYSELESSLAGISPRTLCERLKELAAAGMVTRTRIKGLPPRTMYELTERGVALSPIIEAMRDVGDELLATPPDTAAADAIAADGCCGNG